jgi:hypothetical protein
VHDGGWIRLKGYKYFEVPVRRAAAVAARRWKNARCARVFDPRGALAFAFSGHFPPQETPRYINRFRAPGTSSNLLGQGAPGVHRLTSDNSIPSQCLFSHSAPPESPDTRRLTRLPTLLVGGQAGQATFTILSLGSFFFLISRSETSTCTRLAVRIHDNKNYNNNHKSVTLCSQQRAPDCFASCLTRETPSGRCQGKTRSGRRVVVSSAPLNLPRTHTTLRGIIFLSFPPPPPRPAFSSNRPVAPPSPRSPPTDAIFSRLSPCLYTT